MTRSLPLAVLAGFIWFFIVTPGSTAISEITFNEYQVTDNSGDEGSIDAALDISGNIHIVYVRSGNIYYKLNFSDEELVAAGSAPAIAVDATGVCHLAFLSGGQACYTNRTGGTWQAVTTLLQSSAGYIDIDVDPSAKAHIVYQANGDGDGYGEIFYANNTGGAFAETLIADGWYDSGSGNYYYNPSIKIDGSGYYHIAFEVQSWGGRASWSSKNIALSTNAAAGNGGSGGFDWNAGVTVARNGVAIDGSGSAHVLYYSGNSLFDGSVATDWVQTPVASGTQSSMAASGATVAVAYNDGADNITYTENTGAGYGAPLTVCSGRNPVVLLGGGRYILFERHDGTDYEVFLRSDVEPLPVQLVAFAAAYLDGGTTLRWSTLSETNNFGFLVQRLSLDGKTFADIDGSFVAGHGTTAVPQQYSFTDPAGGAGAWYRLRQVDLDGTSHFSERVQASVLASAAATTPRSTRLMQNYPNPFNPVTSIAYSVGDSENSKIGIAGSIVQMVVYDMLGRQVATLVNEAQMPGDYQVQFNAAGLASGTYICRLTAGNIVNTRTMVLMR